MKGVFLATVINMVVPLAISSYVLRGLEVISPEKADSGDSNVTTPFERNLMFCLGFGILVMDPVFKTITPLPPFMGILLGLGLLCFVGNIVHRNKEEDQKEQLTLVHALCGYSVESDQRN